MSCNHTLVILHPAEKVQVADGRHGKCSVNFGDAASINITLAQAEEVAAKLRAWIDDHMPPTPSLALVKTDAA